MSKPLVIVESPAKARTIAGYLGSEFQVESSVGHVRDLPSKGLSIDVDDGFTPTYEVHTTKKDVIRKLKAALKEADELYLATDGDREGEAISWHLLEILKPKIPVKRMVFNEITPAAIESAVENWRDIDEGLVDAQETRRIVDRLWGYPVSEVLWRKVGGGLSSGRVQTPAIRLVVERERERIAFITADYWSLTADFSTDPRFEATLRELDGRRLATGKDFDDRGRLTGDRVVLDETAAAGLKEALTGASFSVRSVEEKPYTSRPKAPFMTSTLQQEGGRKLRMSSRQVMSVAQSLYQNGYITYMRTDSTTLSETALTAARAQVRQMYGEEYLPPSPRTYDRKVKNAQEAHEAIRPAGDSFRTPAAVRSELSRDEARLYELIWQRTVASQMADARGQTVSVRLGATASDGRDAEFSASGRTIVFPGYMRAYVEGSDDPDAALDDRETILPILTVGQNLPDPGLEAKDHSTKPPARYTEASLVKRLEELGIGRPSTYASIMSVIQERGYVWKKGSALVPTWTAFAVIRLLEEHFGELVDYEFTARMEDELDGIAHGTVQREPWLNRFWFGDEAGEQPADLADISPDSPGLKELLDRGKDEIDPAEINVVLELTALDGERIVVKPGRYGPYLKKGDQTASIPDDLAPDELTADKAIELLEAPSGDREVGVDPESGLTIYAKAGRFGPYVQLGEMPEGKAKASEKPKTASLFKTMTLERLTVDEALQLLSLPRTVGTDPSDGGTIEAMNGRYGPYIKKDWVDEDGATKSDTRSIDSEEQLLTITLDEALAVLAQPKRRRGQGSAAPLRELGEDPVSGKKMVVKDGRFGPYVTDGETNASLRKDDAVEDITDDRAAELLQMRRERGPAKKKATRKKAAAKKKSTAKKATAKKTAAKKAPAKKAAAKKTAAKKTAAKKVAAKKTAEPPVDDEPPF